MYAQCVRLSVHLGFIIRAAPVDPKRQRRFQKVAFVLNRRASLYFSLGLRFQYAFFPMVLYLLGPLAFLISTVIEIAVLVLMDLTPDELVYAQEYPLETEEEYENSLSGGGAGGETTPLVVVTQQQQQQGQEDDVSIREKNKDRSKETTDNSPSLTTITQQ